jgi:hypothetical protein
MIKEKVFVELCTARYFSVIGNVSTAIRLLPYLLPTGVLPAMAGRLRMLEGDEVASRVLDGTEFPPPGVPSMSIFWWWCMHCPYAQGYLDDETKPLPYIGLAARKRYISFYHLGLYSKPGSYEWFLEEYSKLGYDHKADIGKSCVRLKYLDEIPYNLIGQSVRIFTIDEWIAEYERSRSKRT